MINCIEQNVIKKINKYFISTKFNFECILYIINLFILQIVKAIILKLFVIMNVKALL